MRLLLAFLFCIATFSGIAWLMKEKKGFISPTPTPGIKTGKAPMGNAELARLGKEASSIEKYARLHHFNTGICFLVDMRISSGKKRFFVYDMQRDSVLESGLVAHGTGSGSGDSLHFSNEPGSNSTSLGRYRIGNPYQGTFGLAYKLHGLDETNSRAFERFVVLHSHECVPDTETAPYNICRSWGCPTVAPAYLVTLKKYLDKTEKPMLLDIFY